MRSALALLALLALSASAAASEWEPLGLVATERGVYCLLVFVIAYVLVMTEEFIELKKSKPVIIAAIIIWAEIAYLASTKGISADELQRVIAGNVNEYGQLMLFLLVAMTYINAMAERNVFERLRSWLISRNFGYRKLFWITGVIAFFSIGSR